MFKKTAVELLPVKYKKDRTVFFFFVYLFAAGICTAQHTVITGKITESSTGNPVPFANVFFKGTSIGTTTDFDGNYSLTSDGPTDSLIASYIGYKPRSKAVVKGISQRIDFQLEEDITKLDEIVIEAGENPAFDIMRNVVKNKDRNDKRKLSAYEYDTYTKIEIDLDNIYEKFQERKIVKKITQVLDSIDRIAGEDGKPVLPVFISESISKLYYRDNPRLKTEHILKSKINGIGVEDGTLVTQVIGSSFQEYNFYQNWLEIVTKEFVSPIADGWRLFYEYDLTDSLFIEDHFCYRLDFFPKNPEDIAFTGSMWITKEEYALKRIDVSIGKGANINFIEKLKIQQELEPTHAGPWLPVNNRVLIDVKEVNPDMAGLIAKFYTSNKNFIINKPYDNSFYEQPIVATADALVSDSESTWDSLRHEPLSDTEKSVYRMIDTLRSIPVVKTYTEITKVLVNGYYRVGKLQLGPYSALLAVNNIEGVRIQGGFKTNIHFSKRWVLGAQLGYGFKDDKVKYSVFVQNILSRRRWTTLDLRVRSDIGRVGVEDEDLSDNEIFLAAQRFGQFRRGYYFDEVRIDFRRELFKGFTQRLAARYSTFNPLFDFGYYLSSDVGASIRQTYQTTEVIVESRYARDELFLQNDNERISLGATKWPVVTLRYTHGISDIAGSDFDYQKIRLSVYKRIRLGALGVGYLNTVGEYVFGVLPYPLLSMHLGNQTPIYTSVTYNLMNYGEFVSDRFASVKYEHHFDGLLFNRVPLMRKLKWRMVGTVNVVYGRLNEKNQLMMADTSPPGTVSELPGSLATRPYVELGYGVENIFKFFRVDFIHRVTYLDKPDARQFGVFVSFQVYL